MENDEIEESIRETDEWLSCHFVPSNEWPDLAWYVSLDICYGDYYARMKRLRLKPMAKKEFADYICNSLVFGTGHVRCNSRYFEYRSYDHRNKVWVTKKMPQWVLDGVRYYRDKIGGELVFGL